MALLDIFKRKKQRKVEEKLKRPPKGALKPPKSAKGAAVKKPKTAERLIGGAKEGQSELASEVILNPHITEKSTIASESGVFIFRVSAKANKALVKRAIKELYGLEPVKVRIINAPAKIKFQRGRMGRRPGYKKAMVYLKKGDKIDLG